MTKFIPKKPSQFTNRFKGFYVYLTTNKLDKLSAEQLVKEQESVKTTTILQLTLLAVFIIFSITLDNLFQDIVNSWTIFYISLVICSTIPYNFNKLIKINKVLAKQKT